MKTSLYVKFVSGYLLAALLAFLFVSVLSPRITDRYLLQKEQQRLYTHAQHIRQTYETSGSMEPEDLFSLIHSYSNGLEATIWITDKSGTILLDSDWSSMQEPVETDFNPLDFGRSYSMTGDFYGMFSRRMLTVYIPLSAQFKTNGYVLIHEPLDSIAAMRNMTVNMVFLAAGITFLLTGILLLIFHFTVYRPMKKVSHAVREYSRGNLTYKVHLRSHDEIGYLAAGLNDMSSRLSQTGNDQKKFLANVSHDFRSPLTSIKGYIEAILDGTIPPELQPKYLQIVLDETGRLTKLTQNMLELNTFSDGGTYLDYSTFDINHEIRKVIASMEGICQKKQITFDMIQSERTLMVYADLGRIQQVLYNLIDNAIKFSHTGGVITIETHSRYDQAFISVKDNGTGIARENINKIWERFYKTDASRGRDKKGTGLGLSIVKEIIKAHGTTIDVISTEGVGSEFIFRLKLADEEEEA